MPALIAITGPSAGVRFELRDEAVIGRAPNCEIPLHDGKVSRNHARLEVDGERVMLRDLSSRNGTLVNGKKIAEAELRPGDRVQTGESEFVFEPGGAAHARGPIEASDAAAVLRGAGGDSAMLLEAARRIVRAGSPAAVLRGALEAAAFATGATRGAALLRSGAGAATEVAAVHGNAIAAHRELLEAAIDRGEIATAGNSAVAPLAGRAGFGALLLETDDVFAPDVGAKLAQIAQLAGEAYLASRERSVGLRTVEPLLGSSRGMKRALELARRAAPGTRPMLIIGEEGVGKTALACVIHDLGPRRLAPFLTVDCRLPSRELGELLFGVEGKSPGELERADGGTLHLEEVGAIGRDIAEELARTLSRKSLVRRGGDLGIAFDCRVLASSSEDPRSLASRGSGAAALLQALSFSPIPLPPLRDRKPDIPVLVEHFVQVEARRLRRGTPTIDAASQRFLQEHPWGGNIAELRNVIERLVQRSGGEIVSEDLPPELRGLGSSDDARLADLVAQLEKDVISQALRKARGKKIRAAAALGISRPTLDKKISDYQIEIPRK